MHAPLEHACRALDEGTAVVVANPPPMAYGLVATSATAINAIKRRPAGQAVAVSLHDESEWRRVAPSLDLPSAVLAAVGMLLQRRLSLLLPLRGGMRCPEWMTPAVRGGYLGAFSGRWTATAALWDAFPRLFGSSANLTGTAPAASAAQAIAMFGPELSVADAPAGNGPRRQRLASTMLRLDRRGEIALHRTGIHDATAGSPSEFLRRLATDTGLGIPPDARLDRHACNEPSQRPDGRGERS